MRQETLQVVFSVDRHHFVGLVPAMRSILAHAGRPEALSFHFVVGDGESGELRSAIRAAFGTPRWRQRVVEFRATAFLDDYIRAGRELTYAAYTASVLNFARFYLGDLHPELEKFVYLDADIIVRGDLADLMRLATLERHDLAAVPFATFGSWEDGFRPGWEPLRAFDPAAPVFNNGIFVTELARWRRALPELERWMRIHRRSMEECVFGTQSIMNLVFYRNVEILPGAWNVSPLGYDESVPAQVLDEAKILHWAGQRKPWKADGLYRSYWQPWADAAGSVAPP